MCPQIKQEYVMRLSFFWILALDVFELKIELHFLQNNLLYFPRGSWCFSAILLASWTYLLECPFFSSFASSKSVFILSLAIFCRLSFCMFLKRNCCLIIIVLHWKISECPQLCSVPCQMTSTNSTAKGINFCVRNGNRFGPFPMTASKY